MATDRDKLRGKGKYPERWEILLNQFFAPLVVLIFLAMVIIGYFLVLKVQYGEFVQSRDIDLTRLNQSIKDFQGKRDFFARQAGQVLVIEPAEERLISLALPDSFDFSSLVIQLTTLAEQSNFAVKNIEIAENQPMVGAGKAEVNLSAAGNQLKKVNIKMELAGGSYFDWINLMSNIESSAMIFDTAALEYRPDKSAHSLSLVAYYYPSTNY